MSRMSDAYTEIVELVGDAIEAGAYYLGDVVEYVNARSALKVDRDMVGGIIDSLYYDMDDRYGPVQALNSLPNR